MSVTIAGGPGTQLGFIPLHDAEPWLIWVIALVFLFVECAFIAGLFLPGDSLLVTAGVVLAAGNHPASAWGLALAALVVAVIGNEVGYLIGARGGRRIIMRSGGKVLNAERLDRAQAFLDKHGWWAIAISRFMPYIRTLAPLLAGMARMERRSFSIASIIGAALWIPWLVPLGYYGVDLLGGAPWLHAALIYMGLAFFAFGLVWGAWRWWHEMRKPPQRREREPVPASRS
jgi:membrane-associated protein